MSMLYVGTGLGLRGVRHVGETNFPRLNKLCDRFAGEKVCGNE